MRKTSFIVVFGLILWMAATQNINAQVPVHPGDDPEIYIHDWLLLGPFKNLPNADGVHNTVDSPTFTTDYLTAQGGHETLEPVLESPIDYDGEQLFWKSHHSDTDILDLDSTVSIAEMVAAYAVCDIEVSQAGRYTLSVGSNNGAQIWINGQEVFLDPTIPNLILDQIKIPVTLEAGKNRLLARISERSGTWEFACRVQPFEPAKYYKQEDFKIETTKAGTRIRLEGSPHAVPFEQAAFSLLKDDAGEAPSWTMNWDGQTSVALPLNHDNYASYRLLVDQTYVDGHTERKEITFSTGKKPVYSLFDSGRTPYRIMLSPDASESERWAAEELSRVLSEISGAEFPIVHDRWVPTYYDINIGYTMRTKLTFPNAAKPEFEDEGFHIRNDGPTIFIWGGGKRGTLYGVMDFLERDLGCRWFTSREHFYPEYDKWEFTTIHRDESPAIRFRCTDYFDANEAGFGVPLRNNSHRFNRGEQPGGVEYFWLEHSFDRFVPPAKYFDEHPEYFALRDGERQRHRTQPCLTHPEVLKLCIEGMREIIEEEPEFRVYNVAQSDNQSPCLCDNCQKIAKDEESEAGVMLWFVNQVAEQIEKEYPDKLIGTFAYQYTRKPPKTIRPRENVMIVLCNIECDFSHPLDHENNLSFMDDIRGWSAITDQIFIWDYVTNFRYYILPHPNFGVLQRNIQILRDHKVQGILEQGQYQSLGGELSELRSYLLAKLMWDPDLDTREVIEDFMYGYYGRSAQYMLQYFDLVQSLVSDESYITFATSLNNPIYTHAFVEEAKVLLAKAAAVAEDETYLHRVELASLGVVFMQMAYDPRGADNAGLFDFYERVTTREGVRFSTEGWSTPEFLGYIEKQRDSMD